MIFIRNCPKCNKELFYDIKGNYTYANFKNSLCKSCAAKKACSGKNNPFYGKNHSKESKQKISKNRDHKYLKSDKFKKIMSKVTKGKLNPMYGRKVFDIWVEKYGYDIAVKKETERKEKLSKKFSGKNNPMYGKPTPKLAGKGIGGYYKGFYCRSLHEIYYIITEIERKGLKFESAEKAELKIPYKDYYGNDRTYVADFLVDNRLIEIKPLKLVNSRLVQLKASAAKIFCENKNLIYELIGIEKVDYTVIKNAIDSGDLILNNKKLFN